MSIKPFHLLLNLLSAVFSKFGKKNAKLLIRGLGLAIALTSLTFTCSAVEDDDVVFLEQTGLFKSIHSGNPEEGFDIVEKSPEVSAMDWLEKLDKVRQSITLRLKEREASKNMVMARLACLRETSWTIAGKHGLSDRQATPEEAQQIFGYIAGARQEFLGAKDIIGMLYLSYDSKSCQEKMSTDPRFAAHMAAVAMADAAVWYATIDGPAYDLDLNVIPSYSRRDVTRSLLSAISSSESVTPIERSRTALFIVTTILPESKEKYRGPQEMQELVNTLSKKNLLETAIDYILDAVLMINTKDNRDLATAIEKFDATDLQTLFEQFCPAILRSLSDITPTMRDFIFKLTKADKDKKKNKGKEGDENEGEDEAESEDEDYVIFGGSEACYKWAITEPISENDLYQLIISAWQGYGPALYILGKAYEEGNYGLPINLALRNACFEKAAACGDIKGLLELNKDPSLRRVAAGSLKGIADHDLSLTHRARLQQKLLDGFKSAYDRNDLQTLAFLPEAIFDPSTEEANRDFLEQIHISAAATAA